MTLYIFHGACHTGRGHLAARRRDTAALPLPPLSLSTAMTWRCCSGAEGVPAWDRRGAWRAVKHGFVPLLSTTLRRHGFTLGR